jgi:hypothetical protein
MTHPEVQVPVRHISPVPQLVPLDRLVHVVLLVPGWQLWQGLLVLNVPEV